MVWHVIRSWTFAWVSLLAVAIWWGAQVFPTSRFWFDATTMLVPDAPVGEDVVLVVDREIKRPVFGEWTVTVRRRASDADRGWLLECVAYGSSDYTPEAALPDPVTLSWWTEGQCEIEEPGVYFLTTTWQFRPTWLPGVRRSPPLVSNAFRVLEVPEPRDDP